jgi:hypothetical protein
VKNDGLRTHCDCGVRVRVLWSGPIGPDSRPILLVCGHHPRSPCEFRQVIPEAAVIVDQPEVSTQASAPIPEPASAPADQDSEVERLQREVAEMRALFDMQWKRMGEATARWRAEDPEARALIMPDLGALLQWLMDDADRARAGH